MLFSAVVLAALFGALCVNGQAVMVINHNQPIVVTRLDPIVSPGRVSSHVHVVVGGSRFKATYDSADLLKSQCTTANVPKDKSNYWAPAIYFKFNNGSIGIVNHAKQGFNTYYNNRYDSGDTNPNQVYPFPVGFTMLGGSAKVRSEMGNTTAEGAQVFTCLGGPNSPETQDFPSLEGKDYCTTIRAEIHMPNCWDGTRATSADNSHVAYPLDGNSENGRCPPNFKRIPSLFYECFYDVDPTVMNSKTGQYLIANGDTTGFSMHGDFASGWDQALLEQIVAQCYGKDNDHNNCDIIKQSQTGYGGICQFEGDYADEETGRDSFVSVLPGCIAPGGALTQASCPVPNIKNEISGAIVAPSIAGAAVTQPSAAAAPVSPSPMPAVDAAQIVPISSPTMNSSAATTATTGSSTAITPSTPAPDSCGTQQKRRLE